jgi:hypothetical protein
MTTYRALNGLNYELFDGTEVRVEAGELAHDVPESAAETWLASGEIAVVEDAPKKKRKG